MTSNADKAVFVLDSSGRNSGTADNGSILVQFNNLTPNQSFYLRLTSFNTIFTAPDVSYTKGNSIQMDDGTVIVTVNFPTGYYRIIGSNDIGNGCSVNSCRRLLCWNHHHLQLQQYYKFVYVYGLQAVQTDIPE